MFASAIYPGAVLIEFSRIGYTASKYNSHTVPRSADFMYWAVVPIGSAAYSYDRYSSSG